MVDNQLLRALKDENISLAERLGNLEDENQRLWGLILGLNSLGVNRLILNNPAEILGTLNEILDRTLQAVRADNGSILLYDEGEQELAFVVVRGKRKKELLDYRIPADKGIAGWVGSNQKPALVTDVRQDSRWLQSVDQSIGFHTSSLIAAPLVIEERLLGVLEVVNSRSQDPFREKDLQVLNLVARLTSFVIGFTEEVLKNSGHEG